MLRGPALVAPAPHLPGTQHPPSPPIRVASAQLPGPAPGFLESPAGRWGGIVESPRPAHRSWQRCRERLEGRVRSRRCCRSSSGRTGTGIQVPALCSLASPPAFLLRARAAHPPPLRPVPHGPAGLPAFPRSPCLSRRRLSLSLFHSPSFPFPVPSLLAPWSPRTGAEGRAVEVRGRIEVGGRTGRVLVPSVQPEGYEKMTSVGSRAGGSKNFGRVGVGGGRRSVRPGY